MHTSYLALLAIFVGSKLGQCNNQSPLTVANPMNFLVQSYSKVPTPIFPQRFLAAAQNLPIMLFNSSYLSSIKHVPCTNAIKKLTKDFLNNKPYALEVLDSWARPESGMIYGNLIWEGRYYECKRSSDETSSTGKYCSVSVRLNTKLIPPYLDMFDVPSVEIGVCFPDNCSASDITAVFSSYIPVGEVERTTCPTQFRKWEVKEILAMSLLSLFVLLAVISTAYEYITYWRYVAVVDLADLLGMDMDYSVLIQSSPSISHKIFISFSLIHNTKRLLNTKQQANTISCLHGMRFLSMSWIILGHSFLYLVGSYTDNLKSAAKYILDHYGFQAVLNGSFAVDTFFFLSGLLVAYLGLKQLRKRNGRLNIFMMYLHRYIRLTPPYAFLILMSISVYPKLGDGPWWASSVQPLIDTCQKYWYTSLLYFNNLYPAWISDECYSWGWYLANDMQFYLVSPIFLCILYTYPKIGLALLTLVVTASMTITGKFAAIDHIEFPALYDAGLAEYANPPPFDDVDTDLLASELRNTHTKYFTDLYTKPWCRIGAYLVGMITGYILYATNNNVRMKKIVAIVGWIVSCVVFFLLIFCLYPYYDTGFPNKLSAFYNAVSRPVWCVCLAWVTVACVSGYGGPVNTLLSWKAFIPLSRLTYCAYLVHPLCIWWFVATGETQYHFSVHSTLLLFFTILVTSYLLACVIAILVEFPFIELLNILENRDGSPAATAVRQSSTESENLVQPQIQVTD